MPSITINIADLANIRADVIVATAFAANQGAVLIVPAGLVVKLGTTATSAAAGDDARITGALQKAANLSDIVSASAARVNLGLGNIDNTSDANKPVSTATAALVAAAINNLVNGAPGQLDTIKELADALGDDANFATTITAALAGKLDIGGEAFQLPTWDFNNAAATDGNFLPGNANIAPTDSIEFARKARTNTGLADFGIEFFAELQLPFMLIATNGDGITSSFKITALGDNGSGGTLMTASNRTAGEVSWSGRYRFSFAPCPGEWVQTQLDTLQAALTAEITDRTNADVGTEAYADSQDAAVAVGAAAYADSLAANYATAAQGATADSAVQPTNPGLVPPDPTAGWIANGSVGDKTVAVADYDRPVDYYAGLDLLSLNNVRELGDQVVALTKQVLAIKAALVAGVRPTL